jgi:hypothetical protein
MWYISPVLVKDSHYISPVLVKDSQYMSPVHVKDSQPCLYHVTPCHTVLLFNVGCVWVRFQGLKQDCLMLSIRSERPST